MTETSHPVMFAKLTSKIKTTGCKSRSIEEKTLQFSPHSDKETPMVFSILGTINAKNVRIPEDRTFSRTLMPWNSKREVFQVNSDLVSSLASQIEKNGVRSFFPKK